MTCFWSFNDIRTLSSRPVFPLDSHSDLAILKLAVKNQEQVPENVSLSKLALVRLHVGGICRDQTSTSIFVLRPP